VYYAYITKHHRVIYYRCHRGGKKRSRKRRKGEDVSISTSRRERKSMKCDCEFQMKVMIPLEKEKCTKESNISREAVIFVHTTHSGHHPGTEVDKMFLPVHPLVISFAVENLKHMISTSTVALASVREETKVQAMVEELERATYRFFLIPKEIEQISYFLKLNGNYFVHSFF